VGKEFMKTYKTKTDQIIKDIRSSIAGGSSQSMPKGISKNNVVAQIKKEPASSTKKDLI